MNDVAEEILPVDVTVAGDWDAKAWDAYALARGVEGHFHAYPWRNVIWKALRHRPHYLIAQRRGAVTGILPLFDVRSRLFGRSLISVPFLNGGGILADDDASVMDLKSHTDKRSMQVVMSISIEIKDLPTLSTAITRLEQVPNVVSVRRKA